MSRTIRHLAAASCAAALLVATIGCSSSDTSKTVGTAAPPEEAKAAFCDDLADHLTVLDRYGRVFTENQVTVGQLESDAQELEAGQAKVERSASQLSEAITAANTAATAVPGSESTTTTVLASMSADDHIKAIDKAAKDLDKAVEGVDKDTPVTQAAAEVQAAAFGLEQAYSALFLDAGCLADDATAAKAVRDYTAGLQRDLTTLGYYTGTVDGVYGPATVAAIKALQDSAGLTQTGVVDPQTEAALTQQLGQKGKQEALNIAALEGALTAAGYYTGPIDGTWTPAVESALKAFQTDQNLPATGTLDPATLAALLDQSGAATDSTSSTTSSTGGSSTTTTAAP